MNDLAPINTGTAVAIPAPESNPFLEAGESNRTIIGTLLKFKKGDYFAGQDNDEVAIGTNFIVDTDNYLWGWIRWWDNKPSEQRMGRVAEFHKPAPRHSLGDHLESEWETDDRGNPKDPWQETHYIFLKDPEVDGEGEEGIYTFTVSSITARNSMKKFLSAYGKLMRQHPNEFPIISLGVGYYDSDDYGRIKYPEFKIVGWAEKGGFGVAGDGQESLALEAPKATKPQSYSIEPEGSEAAPAAKGKQTGATGKTRF